MLVCRLCGRLFADGIPDGAVVVKQTAFWTLITFARLAHILVPFVEKPIARSGVCKATGCLDTATDHGFCWTCFVRERNRRLKRWRERKAA